MKIVKNNGFKTFCLVCKLAVGFFAGLAAGMSVLKKSAVKRLLCIAAIGALMFPVSLEFLTE